MPAANRVVALFASRPPAAERLRRIECADGDDVDPFSSEEQAAILDALSGQNKNLIQFALWTGLRTSELCALEWGDIDWKRGTVRVQRAKTQASDEAETTKTRSGVRDVKLLKPALEALQATAPCVNEGVAWYSKSAYRRSLDGRSADTPWRVGAGDTPGESVRYRRPYQTRPQTRDMRPPAIAHG
jgi:integrase